MAQGDVEREVVVELLGICKFCLANVAYLVVILSFEAYEEIVASLANFADYVGSQTLALSVEAAQMSEAGDAPEVEWNEGAIRIAVARR